VKIVRRVVREEHLRKKRWEGKQQIGKETK
jgi:hypothetical protein